MQNQSQFKVLKNISKVFDKASNSKLSASFYNKAGTDLHYLESYFNLSPNDTLMLTLVFAMNYENNDAIGITEIADHLKISAVKLLEFQESFESLSKIGVLLKSKPGHFNSSRIGISNFKYQVSQKLVSQVISDAPAINLTSECYYDVIDFMERVVLLTEERSYDNISTLQLIDEVMGMVEAHENLPLLKKLSPYKLDILEKIFFINLVWAALNGEEEKDLTSITDDIIGESSMKIRFMQLFLNGRSCLLKHDLIGLSKSEFFNNT